ncbi:hypothetical protein GCM10010393_32800 [Streptomyces gobitricini]|uniref:Uncharacterized protein n=1 Tax=Streptomyces gobitricini TaxID=68211 RepID=A0ABN3M9S9_9ACTN
MLKHRRVRVACVFLLGWVSLAAVERWAEQAPWPTAVTHGVLWSAVLAGTWWFVEMTQGRSSGEATALTVGKASPSGGPLGKGAGASPPASAAESSKDDVG